MAEYKSKGKQPYIPLYIGDWEQDVNSISLEAEGALLKLVLKLWKSSTKGEVEISFNQLSILLKKTQEIALKILKELHENDVLNIEFLPNDKAKIQSRRMLKDASKSAIAKENGSKGGRGKKANQKPTESYLKAKQKLFTENDIDNEYENESVIETKGVQGEFENLIYPFDSENFKSVWQVWLKYKREILKPYHTFSSTQGALQMLGNYPEHTAIEIIKTSITNNWIHLYEPKDNGRKQTSNDRQAGVLGLAEQALRDLGAIEYGNNGAGG